MSDLAKCPPMSGGSFRLCIRGVRFSVGVFVAKCCKIIFIAKYGANTVFRPDGYPLATGF